METKKELEGPYERELMTASDLLQCSTACQRSLEERGYMCRSFNFDEHSQTCILYDEDPLFFAEMATDSVRTGEPPRKPLKQSAGNYYRVMCVDSERGNELERSSCTKKRLKS